MHRWFWLNTFEMMYVHQLPLPFMYLLVMYFIYSKFHGNDFCVLENKRQNVCSVVLCTWKTICLIIFQNLYVLPCSLSLPLLCVWRYDFDELSESLWFNFFLSVIEKSMKKNDIFEFIKWLKHHHKIAGNWHTVNWTMFTIALKICPDRQKKRKKNCIGNHFNMNLYIRLALFKYSVYNLILFWFVLFQT